MAKRTAIPLGIVGLLVMGAWGVLRLDAQRAAPRVAEEPKYAGLSQAERRELRRRILNTVRERGMVESASATTISSRVSGTTTIVRVVEEGRRVRKGEVIVELDDSALKEKSVIQQIVVAKAQARLKQVQSELMVQNRHSAAAAAAAKKALEVAKLVRKQWQEKDGEYALQIATVDAEMRIAEARLQAARNQLKTKGADNDAARVAFAEAESTLKVANVKRKLLAAAERGLPAAKRDLDVLRGEADLLEIQQRIGARKSAAAAALRAAQSAVAVETRGLARIQREIENCKIRATRDGNAFYANQRSRRSEPVVIEEGTTIRERQPIIQIVDTEKLQFRLRVHESHINRVQERLPVTLRIDALPDKTLLGTVRSIAEMPQKGDWPNTDVLSFEVVVSISQPPKELKIDMSGEAEIDVSKAVR